MIRFNLNCHLVSLGVNHMLPLFFDLLEHNIIYIIMTSVHYIMGCCIEIFKKLNYSFVVELTLDLAKLPMLQMSQ